jgi:hypothetical protein
MTAKKKAVPEETAKVAETPAPEPSTSDSTAIGGLAEAQARADRIAARGYLGSEKENSDD